MAAVPKFQLPVAPAPRGTAEDMADPPHPMHRELLRRMTAPGVGEHVDDRWSRPARLATAFYLGLGSWGLFLLLGFAVARVV